MERALIFFGSAPTVLMVYASGQSGPKTLFLNAYTCTP
jgi:hypothetical protein